MDLTGHVEATAKRIRGANGAHTLIDTRAGLLVWEHRWYPQYLFPDADVHADLVPTDQVPSKPPPTNDVLGTPTYLALADADGTTTGEPIAWRYPDASDPRVADHVRVAWSAVQHWFEEDERVIVHPRSPYVRVDALTSTRAVRVEVHGAVVAESRRPTVLFETGLGPRYYLPSDDVRHDLLVASTLTTECPYKGTAKYHSVQIEDEPPVTDVVWHYEDPYPESLPIKGMLCFYDERVTVVVDGVRTR